MNAATIGLNIAKQIFQVHGADKSGKVVFRRRLRRSEVARFFARVRAVSGRDIRSVIEWKGVLLWP
jgi:transposase